MGVLAAGICDGCLRLAFEVGVAEGLSSGSLRQVFTMGIRSACL